MKALKQLVIVLPLTAMLLGAAFGLARYYAPWMTARWQAQFRATPDPSAEALLGRVADVGDVGIAILVEALGSPRPRIALAARRALLEQVEQWKKLPASAGAAKMSMLAEELANRASDFGPAGRHEAAEVAMQILQGPVDSDAVDAARVIACCEKVLRAAHAESGHELSHAEASESKRIHVLTPPSATDGMPGLIGGGNQDGGKPVANAGSRADQTATKPLVHFEPTKHTQVNLIDQKAGQSSVRPGTAASAVQQATATENLPVSALPDDLKPVDSFELLQQTCSQDEQAVSPARAELSRRGFTEVHFDLAKRLFSADPAVRKQLVRALPELRSIDAAPWLLKLSSDADADVRLTAISLMATSGDPTLLEQVERIAADDPDPRIRDQVARIGQQRNDASQRGDPSAMRPQTHY